MAADYSHGYYGGARAPGSALRTASSGLTRILLRSPTDDNSSNLPSMVAPRLHGGWTWGVGMWSGHGEWIWRVDMGSGQGEWACASSGWVGGGHQAEGWARRSRECRRWGGGGVSDKEGSEAVAGCAAVGML